MATKSGISALEWDDLPGVAALFARTLGKKGNAAPIQTADALAQVYLREEAAKKTGVHSLVSYDSEGRLTGFIGAYPMPFIINGQSRMAAFCGAHMIDKDTADGLVGPRLLRALLNGPQDISLSDTANPISDAMWRGARAEVLADYSLEWARPLRPAAFVAQVVGRRTPPFVSKLAHSGFMRPFDAVGSKLLKGLGRMEDSPCDEQEVPSDEQFARLLADFTAHFAARPDWENIELRRMVASAKKKPKFGEVRRRLVSYRGKPLGLYHLHTKHSGVGRVLQVVAQPGRERLVVDSMLASARKWNLSGIQGRTEPALLGPLMSRKCFFLSVCTTVAHAKDQELLGPFRKGDAFLNGFAGEGWTPFFGGLD